MPSWKLYNPADAVAATLNGNNSINLPVAKVAATNLSGHRAVYITALDQIDYASSHILSHNFEILGLTTSAVTAGSEALVTVAGEIVEPSWNWIYGLPIYLGESGIITQTIPSAAAGDLFLLRVAIPVTPTSLVWRLGTPVRLI